MIKLNSKGTAPDYTEHGSVSTECKTVGEFMTEAAAIYGGVDLTIKVDGCHYKFNYNNKIRVTDDNPIEDVTYACAPGSITFIVKTKPKPNTLKKSGWVNIYEGDGERITGPYIFETEAVAKLARLLDGNRKVATVHVEWEEVEQ